MHGKNDNRKNDGKSANMCCYSWLGVPLGNLPRVISLGHRWPSLPSQRCHALLYDNVRGFPHPTVRPHCLRVRDVGGASAYVALQEPPPSALLHNIFHSIPQRSSSHQHTHAEFLITNDIIARPCGLVLCSGFVLRPIFIALNDLTQPRSWRLSLQRSLN